MRATDGIERNLIQIIQLYFTKAKKNSSENGLQVEKTKPNYFDRCCMQSNIRIS